MNEQIITRFYPAFRLRDYATMQSCYSDDAVFSDPVFGLLDATEVRAMWEMLCKRAQNFQLEYSNIQLLDEEYATCRWTATYLFAKTGRKVTNRITAHMRLRDGKIIEHTDAFHFYVWARQAFGITGWLLGWTNFFQLRVRRAALKSLAEYQAKNQTPVNRQTENK